MEEDLVALFIVVLECCVSYCWGTLLWSSQARPNEYGIYFAAKKEEFGIMYRTLESWFPITAHMFIIACQVEEEFQNILSEHFDYGICLHLSSFNKGKKLEVKWNSSIVFIFILPHTALMEKAKISHRPELARGVASQYPGQLVTRKTKRFLRHPAPPRSE